MHAWTACTFTDYPTFRGTHRRLLLVTSSLFPRQIGSMRLPKLDISESHRITRRTTAAQLGAFAYRTDSRCVTCSAERTFMTRRFTSLAIAFSCDRYDKANSERRLRSTGPVTFHSCLHQSETLRRERSIVRGLTFPAHGMWCTPALKLY